MNGGKGERLTSLSQILNIWRTQLPTREHGGRAGRPRAAKSRTEQQIPLGGSHSHFTMATRKPTVSTHLFDHTRPSPLSLRRPIPGISLSCIMQGFTREMSRILPKIRIINFGFGPVLLGWRILFCHSLICILIRAHNFLNMIFSTPAMFVSHTRAKS
jgi:hypothetical protein